MKKMIIKCTLFVCILSAFLSCKQDSLIFKGKIYDINSQKLIEKATLSIESRRTGTNAKGEFDIRDLKTNLDYYIRIEHENYVTVVRRIRFTAGGNISLNFPLIPRGKEQRFNAADSIVIKEPGGFSIEVKPNSFITKDKGTYTGEVAIRATFINPKENNFIVASPSTFITSDNKPLQTYGMAEIYATTPKGERLDIRKDRPVKITIPNISGLIAGTGLYRLNMENGLWIREGEFSLNTQTNTLSGMVTSISSAWNADQPCSNTLVCIRVQVVDNNNTPRPGYFIGAKGLSYLGYTGLFQTDANGYVNLYVCPNSVFKFVGDIIPCCDPGSVPGTPEHTFCCVNGGQIQGPAVDMNTVNLTPPCTDLGQVIMNP